MFQSVNKWTRVFENFELWIKSLDQSGPARGPPVPSHVYNVLFLCSSCWAGVISQLSDVLYAFDDDDGLVLYTCRRNSSLANKCDVVFEGSAGMESKLSSRSHGARRRHMFQVTGNAASNHYVLRSVFADKVRWSSTVGLLERWKPANACPHLCSDSPSGISVKSYVFTVWGKKTNGTEKLGCLQECYRSAKNSVQGIQCMRSEHRGNHQRHHIVTWWRIWSYNDCLPRRCVLSSVISRWISLMLSFISSSTARLCLTFNFEWGIH